MKFFCSAGPAQIQVAVFETDRLVRARVVRQLEGGRLGDREDRQRVGGQLHVAGRQLRVLVPAALADGPRHADTELAAQLGRLRVRRCAGLGLEDDLGETSAVAQIDEDAPAVIAPGGHPSEEDGARAGVAGAKCAAVVSTFEVDEELGHGRVI